MTNAITVISNVEINVGGSGIPRLSLIAQFLLISAIHEF